MKTVNISVLGGIVGVDHVPSGVKVIVKDYDVDGVDEEELRYDKYGDPYTRMEYVGGK